ncbi:MAG: serine protease [Verrucomicrobia bacterium]|nr:serine protease [Verrucomicrobiota bacterium]
MIMKSGPDQCFGRNRQDLLTKHPAKITLGSSSRPQLMKQAWLSVLFGLIGCAATAASDFATTVAEATFQVTNSTVGATCFFVRREARNSALYLVTAAHFFEHSKGATATVALRERRPDGSYCRCEHILATSREGQRLWVRHATEDAAVLQLSEPPPVAVAALPFSALADEARLSAAGVDICTSVFVLTYPARLEWNEAGFPVARQGIIASHPLVPVERYRTYLANFTTFHGDSGAPLFLRDTKGHPLVIGMVTGELRRDEAVTMEYEEQMIHHRVGLGIVLQTQFIRETIELAAKQPATDPGKKPQSPNSAHAVDGGVSLPPKTGSARPAAPDVHR